MRRPAVVWTAATLVAAVLATTGVVLYAESPGVATYQLNALLILPLLALLLLWLHRLLPLRLQWIAAWFVAPLGGIAYLTWPNEQWWNYGALTVMPLVALAVAREGRQKADEGSDPSSSYGGWVDGPWGPP